MSQSLPFFVTIPHSGERIPLQAQWLNELPEKVLMSDVDRYVDRLYEPALNSLGIEFLKTEWHRYAVDLNRIPTDVDEDAVMGASKKSGTHPDGYHWVLSKSEMKIIKSPMSRATHEELTALIFEPFHAGVRKLYEKHKITAPVVYHLDAHSMPSKGTRMHRDPGETRADIVVSDCNGTSCSKLYRDLVIAAYATAGFKVGYNWPYLGGRVTETYGKPSIGQHAIQVELSRGLYMDEESKQILPEHFKIQEKIGKALAYIKSELPKLIV